MSRTADPSTTAPLKVKPPKKTPPVNKHTGNMSYTAVEDGSIATKSVQLYIKRITQSNAVTGQNYQSRYSRHFYPRYYNPGTLDITCQATSQRMYQNIATFIRNHHKSISHLGISTYRNGLADDNNKYLITLNIPHENIHLRGFVNRITLSKKGVFDPAPEFTFSFTILYDKARSSSLTTSNTIRKWYTAGPNDAQMPIPIPRSKLDTSTSTGKDPANTSGGQKRKGILSGKPITDIHGWRPR